MAKVEVEREGAVWTLTLNRPEVRNAVDAETAALLEQAIGAFAADDVARAMVVTGAGEAFCAGADLKAMDLLARPGLERSSPMGFGRLDPGKPTFAAVNGGCFAGGMELAAWCDVRIADDRAEFGVLNRRWGIPLVDGGTQRLPRIMGLGNALYLIETGVRIGARRALELGFVQEVVPAGTALRRAGELAAVAAAYPAASLRADRASALAALASPLAEGLEREARDGLATIGDPEMTEELRRFAAGDLPEPPRG
ncbi:MAG TPA: enoyl-CoA hydratase-related protein [Actinomycetota bacterium]|nr:enoyl-CoA hydratase-related protein [Actinomycetota bacterium]